MRAGKVTGSCANALLAVRKKGTGELAIRRDLRERLTVERLTGLPVDDSGYKGKDIQHGVETEPLAAIDYEVITGEMVSHYGFLQHDELAAGCSPDGVIGNFEGVLEVKCPASSTHVEYIRGDRIPEEYYGQLVHALWITGAAWADFCSFDPRMQDAPLRLFRRRLERKAVDFAAYELAVRLFLDEVEAAVEAMRSLNPYKMARQQVEALDAV